MRTTIDGAGRLVVPKQLRDRLALGEQGVVEIFEHDGVLEIHPVPAEVELRADEDGLVAHAVGDVPPLTDEEVRLTAERLRR